MARAETGDGDTDDMSGELDTARDDIVFLKALVTEGGQAQSSLGFLLFWAGLLYGLHALFCAAAEMQWVAWPQNIFGVIIGAAPTLIFLGFIGYVVWHDRQQSQHGVATRALNAAFGGAGIASLTTSTIFGYLAISRGEMFLWMFHPITIFVVQGTVWYIAFAIRRRAWLGLVAAGWHLSAVAMAILLNKGMFAPLLLILGGGLLLLMALPGWVLWRSARA